MKGLTFADNRCEHKSPFAEVALGFTSSFVPRCRLEKVYLIYAAEKNRGLTLRLHLLFTLGWLVATLKTVAQAFDAYGE